MSVNILEKFKNKINNIEKQNEEILWSKIWDDTKRDIGWLQDLPGISPGRWAVGYNYIYVMTRVLDILQPDSVLDIGLGISSTLVSCYFNYRKMGRHIIIEHDKEWADFYLKKHILSESSRIHYLECVEIMHKKKKCFVYKDFEKLLASQKFSVVSVDAPWGSERYSRRDIIKCMPGILENNFVIIMDDTNRQGERDTIIEIEDILSDNGIEFSTGTYYGVTDCTVICSKNYQFLCTM